eukprot:993476_1
MYAELFYTGVSVSVVGSIVASAYFWHFHREDKFPIYSRSLGLTMLIVVPTDVILINKALNYSESVDFHCAVSGVLSGMSFILLFASCTANIWMLWFDYAHTKACEKISTENTGEPRHVPWVIRHAYLGHRSYIFKIVLIVDAVVLTLRIGFQAILTSMTSAAELEMDPCAGIKRDKYSSRVISFGFIFLMMVGIYKARKSDVLDGFHAHWDLGAGHVISAVESSQVFQTAQSQRSARRRHGAAGQSSRGFGALSRTY